MNARALSPTHRRVLAACVLVALGVAVVELARSSYVRLATGLVDFRVLYCAGRAAIAGGNPYLVEPLRTCEHAYADPSIAASANIVYPFALPPYVIAPFALLARLPFAAAAWVYETAAVIALCAAVVLLARALRLPLAASAAALLLSIGLASFSLGQLAPFELLFVAMTALALARGSERAAGLSASLTLLEPHVGAFVVIAVALFAPRTRLALLLGVAVLGVVALACGGTHPGTFLAEARLQVLSQARDDDQYSLSALLAWAGVSVPYAMAAGALSTLLMFVLSPIVARAAARVTTAALAVVPPLFAVCGGSYIHITQIGLAVPAALLAVRYARDDAPASRLALTGLLLLAVPWPAVAAEKQVTAAALLVIAVLLWYAGASYARIAALAVLCFLLLWPLQNSLVPAPPAAHLPRAAATDLGSTGWASVVAQRSVASRRTLVIKLPTWLGLIATLAATIRLARRELRA